MDDYAGFKTALAESKHIIVLAGAGLSAASGIPAFRGAGGLWRKYEATDLATRPLLTRSAATQLYAANAKLNPSHHYVRCSGSLCTDYATIAPSAQSVRLVTQNIDNLSNRVLPHGAPASAQPLEIHGNLFKVRCTECGKTTKNTDEPICPALAGVNEDLSLLSIDVKDLIPRCADCGGLLRPDVVWFGETPHDLDYIADLVTKECDMIPVVGTSASVLPCGIFPDLVRDAGGKVAVFNTEKTFINKLSNCVFHGPCEETLVRALS